MQAPISTSHQACLKPSLPRMSALRYDAPPVLRTVGGLMDSVFDIDYADKTEELRNDFVSHQTDKAAFEAALGRVIDLCYSLPARSRKLALQDMVYNGSRK